MSDPEAVNQGIVDLANQTFDRLSGRLAIYAADERRDREPEGTTLTADNANVLWEEGVYGRVGINIAQQESAIRVAQAFLADPFINAAILDPEVSHHEFLESRLTDPADSGESPRRFSPQGYILQLRALRDKYPRGFVDAREPHSRSYARRAAQCGPEDYGERHAVGVKITARYADEAAPDRSVRWDFGVSIQTRFDEPDPQVKVESDLRYGGQIGTEEDPVADLTEDEDMTFGIKKKLTQPAASDNVAIMEELFQRAKDIRPMVTGIRALLRERAAFERFIVENGAERFFAQPDAPASAAV